MFTKEFQKYTKENLPVRYFCSNLSTDSLIFARCSPDCHIFSAVSVDTHIGYSKSHIAIQLYGLMAIIWLYGCIAIWLFGSLISQSGCLRKEHYKCGNLGKTLQRLDCGASFFAFSRHKDTMIFYGHN